MNKKIADRTYLALKYLYLNAKDVQNDTKIKNLHYPHPLSYAKEFCTIRLTTARRGGHSSAIARFINEYYDNQWVLISINQNMSLHNLNKIKLFGNKYIQKMTTSSVEYKNKNKTGKTILTSLGSFERDMRGLDINGVIVDGACMLSNKAEEKLYNIGMECMRLQPHQFFIFVE